jgi:hypothetical protein
MGDAFAESLLRHLGVEDPALEIVDLGGLSARGAQGTKRRQTRCKQQ